MNIGIYDHDIFYAQNLACKLSKNCPENIHFNSHCLDDISQTMDAYDMIITEKIHPQGKKPQIKLNKYIPPCSHDKTSDKKNEYTYYRFGEPGLLANYIINHEQTRHSCILNGNKLQIIYLPFAQSAEQIWEALLDVKSRDEKLKHLIIPLYPHHLVNLEKKLDNETISAKNAHESLSTLLAKLINNQNLEFSSAFQKLSDNMATIREIECTADLFPTGSNIWSRFIEELLAYQNQTSNTNLIFVIAQMPLHYFKDLFQKADHVFLINDSPKQVAMTKSIFHHLDIQIEPNVIELGAMANG